MEKLAEQDIETRLGDHSEWSLMGDSLQRTISFDDFRDAIKFVNRLAEVAENQQHHPDIMIRYNKVTLSVSTHDAGGVTEKDFNLTEAADEIIGDM